MTTGNGSKMARRYNVRNASGEWLACVVICDDGYFSTVSDYGNYAYYWSHAGECFRRFLLQLDADYLVGKIAPGYEYDGPATLRSVRREICQRRRDGYLTRAKARAEWGLVADADLDCREGFAIWYQETRLEEAHELSCHRRNPQAMAFAEKVWPALCDAIRKELAAEGSAAA